MDAEEPRPSPAEQRSFGSNCLPHSQSHKISIGVLAETTQKLNSGVKDDEVAIKSAKNEAQCRNLLQENFKRTSTNFLPGESAQVSGKEHSLPHTKSNTYLKSDKTSSEQSRKKARNMEKKEEVAGATMQESNELNKEKQVERAAQRCKETLRMKLSEILGTASSPTKKSASFETPSNTEKGLKPEGHFDPNNVKAANSRQDTDTIENDSMGPNPNETKRKLVTRSPTKKTATNKQKPAQTTSHAIGNRGKWSHSSVGGCGLKRKNMFSFSEEIMTQNIHVASDVNTYNAFYKKGERNSNGLEQKKNYVNQTEEKREREKTELPAQKSSSHGRARNFHGHLPRDDQKDQQSMNGFAKENHKPPATNKEYQKQDDNGPELHGETGLQEDLHRFSPNNNEEMHFEDNKQQMGVETPIQKQNYSPCLSAQRSKQTEHSAHSPAAAQNNHREKDLSSSRTFWNSKASSFQFDVEPEFSDGFEEFKTPSIRKSSPGKEEKLSDGMTQLSAEQDIDSFEEPTIKKGPKPIQTPESDYCETETSSFMHRSTKMPHRQGFTRTKEFSLPFPSLKGTQQSNRLEEPSDAQNEDSLARVVVLFASALERVGAKMKLLVTQKTKEVLASVMEETKLQLRDFESQIANDVEKFKILEESKRRTLEKKFQEQQECLSIMYEKFEEDMHKHFEDCQATLEELEVYQREQKGGVGKLKSLHKKLLLQVEEGIGSQISDAERRIMMVQKVARHKMLHLRHVIMKFLSEDD